MDKSGTKTIAQNRKAYHDYFVEDRYEAGIELFGTEVKSIRVWCSKICRPIPPRSVFRPKWSACAAANPARRTTWTSRRCPMCSATASAHWKPA